MYRKKRRKSQIALSTKTNELGSLPVLLAANKCSRKGRERDSLEPSPRCHCERSAFSVLLDLPRLAPGGNYLGLGSRLLHTVPVTKNVFCSRLIIIFDGAALFFPRSLSLLSLPASPPLYFSFMMHSFGKRRTHRSIIMVKSR